MNQPISSNKRERFKRLAEYRTNQVLKRIKVLSNCANKSAYEYTEDEINRIFNEIEKSVKEAKNKFHFRNSTKKFHL
jgi:PP-loop superfamily ATP-utilizing enzyme